MDLEGLFAIVLFLLHWRVTLCLVGTTIIAVVLVQAFSWLTGFQGVVIAFLGILPGALWEAEAMVRTAKPTQKRETTVAAAAGAALLAGATWGASSSASAHSFFAGAVIFAVTAWGWYRYSAKLQPPFPKERAILCVALAAIAYPIAAVAIRNAR